MHANICTPTHPVNVPRNVVRVVARLVERVRKAENGHDRAPGMTAPILGHEVQCRVGFVGEFGYRTASARVPLPELRLEPDPRPGARPIPLPEAPESDPPHSR
jgi:hypothetical protein